MGTELIIGKCRFNRDTKTWQYKVYEGANCVFTTRRVASRLQAAMAANAWVREHYNVERVFVKGL